jgi:hypothetical protein
VDDDEVAWARAILLRTRRPTPNEKVRAYRILTAAHPGAYRRELARALAERGFVYGSGVALEDRLALLEEAADAARAVADSEPGRAELVVRVLDMYQMTLDESGLWPQVLAIREEMSVVSRAALARGERGWVEWGLRRWAHGLAEEGRHREATAVLAELVEATRSTDPAIMPAWDQMSLVAQLDAAGQIGDAITSHLDLLEAGRAKLRTDATPVGAVFYDAVLSASLLDRGGCHREADLARHEARRLVQRLAVSGEPKQWSGAQFTIAAILLGTQAQPEEPVVAGERRPAFGVDVLHWSRDVRTRYFGEAGLPPPEAGAASGLPEAASPLAALAAQRRRFAIRTALYCIMRRGHRFLEPTRPAFDASVDVARRLCAETGDAGRAHLVRALTDRAMLLVAGHMYVDALRDYEEALATITA